MIWHYTACVRYSPSYIQALRDELAASESRFEEERAAHVTTRQVSTPDALRGMP